MKILFVLALGTFIGFVSPVQAEASRDRVRDPVVSRNHTGIISVNQARAFVALLYNAILFRDPEPAGLHFWTGQILNGGYQGLINVAGAIAASDEFRNNVATQYYTDEILDNFYYVLLQRQVDPAGYQGWMPYLDSGRTDVVARGIVGSPEFRRLYGVF